MRRFTFELEKVLELRRYVEREWELKLADVTSRVIGVERQIAEWAGRRVTTTSAHVATGQVDMSLLHSRDAYLNLIDDRVHHLQRRLVALEAERAKVREDYLQVSRKRKALTKLKERRSDEYYKDALKDEDRSLDEIAVSMSARRLIESEDEHV